MKPSLPQVLHSSEGKGWNALDAVLIQSPAGLSQAKESELHRLGMHFGPPVNADCSVGGKRMRRLQKPGDIDVIPAGADGSWDDDAACQVLLLSLRPSFLAQVAEELERDASRLEIAPRMQMRDRRVETLAWAVRAELEADTASDPLFVDHLASALAVRLVEIAFDGKGTALDVDVSKLSKRQLIVLTDHIEANLDRSLRLPELAALAGVGVTRFKTIFRNSVGMPVHQYVIRRRIELARALIATTTMPASEIAVAAGFAHQSHMSTTMRRVLGRTPGEIGRQSGKN